MKIERKVNKLLRARDVADRLGLSQLYVYELIRDGKLASVRVGTRSIRVPEDDVERFIVDHQKSRVSSVALMLGRSTSYIYQMVKDGRLKATTVDGSIHISDEDVRDYLERQNKEG